MAESRCRGYLSNKTSSPSLLLLGAPTLGLALSITTLSTLVPLRLRELTPSTALIGAIVGGEGLLALVLPVVLGPLSDRTRTRFGGRLPYVMLGALLCTLALLALPFASALSGLALAVLAFYLGYFSYYTAYRALYPDTVPPEFLGRSQGVQTLFREIGLLLSLTLGPLAFSWWRPLPFLACAAVCAALSSWFVWRMSRQSPRPLAKEAAPHAVHGHGRRALWRLLVANALWEFALASLKTFVLLYVTVGLGRSVPSASALFAVVAVVAIIAAPVAGNLADRFGVARTLRAALLVYAGGLCLPLFTQSLTVLLPALPLIGFGATVAMALPYALFAQHLPPGKHGAGAGLYELSRGAGTLLGPPLAGVAIDAARPLFPQTQGYTALWLVCALALLLSVPLLPMLRPIKTAT